MQLRGPLPRPIVAQIVDIHAVDHMRDAALARDRVEAREEFVLAVETPVAIVFHIFRILELLRGDVFMPDSPNLREILRVALVGLGQGSRIGG